MIMTISVDKAPVYTVIPALEIPDTIVVDYWQRLHKKGLLKDRLCDIENPTPLHVLEIMQSPLGQTMFLVWDRQHREFRAEFALTNFTGKSAMVHFSMHPENPPQQSMHYARAVTDEVLNVWHERENPSVPYLYSLYGLTPVTNRAACAFVQRVGFRKIGTLPKGQRVNGTEFVDAMITIKARKEDGREGIEQRTTKTTRPARDW